MFNVWGKQLGKYDDELNVKICPKTLMRRRNLLKVCVDAPRPAARAVRRRRRPVEDVDASTQSAWVQVFIYNLATFTA